MDKTFDFKTVLIISLASLLIGVGVTYYLASGHYKEIVSDLKTELNEYKAKYSTTVEEKEKAIIAKAIAEERANTPIKEYIKGDTVTTIQYIKKESEDDADLEMTNKPTVSFEYNGVRQELEVENKDGFKFVDGKWVITQETSTVLNVDDIVNRSIANTIDKKDNEIKTLKRQKIQKAVWGTLIGVGIGKAL